MKKMNFKKIITIFCLSVISSIGCATQNTAKMSGYFTTPFDGATVKGVVHLDVHAKVPDGVANVQILIDGKQGSCGPQRLVPYDCDWFTNAVENGPHKLSATIIDKVGSTYVVPPIIVTVKNSAAASQGISGHFTTPSDGAIIKGVVHLDIHAKAPNGVANVQILIDGKRGFCGPQRLAPYDCDWNTNGVGNGPHTLSAVVIDKVGNTYAVPPITVTVDNSAAASQEATIEARVDTLFAEWDRPDSPGVALAVIRDGKIIYTKGYGMANLEHSIPITSESVFCIASTSKQFTAMCILLLEEEGKLSLDDDIRDYLPDFPAYDRPITIRHLIHHTSGIRDYTTLLRLADINLRNSIPDKAVYDLLCRQKRLNFSPGEQYMYSNSGYLLLAMIVKNVSGQTLREYAEERIFHTLGMVGSHFHDNVAHIINKRASGYGKNANGGFENITSRRTPIGSGGLYTNVRDLFKWDQNFYNNQLGKNGQGLIEKMCQKGKLNNGNEIDYAFGLKVEDFRGLKTIEHGGGSSGYQTEFLRFPDQRFSVILLSNLIGSLSDQAYDVADIYLSDLLAPKKSRAELPVVARKKIDIDPKLLDKYIGRYKIRPGHFMDIIRDGDKLIAHPKGGPKLRLLPEANNKFFFEVITGFDITFEPEKKQFVYNRGGEIIVAKRFKPIELTQDLANQYTGDYFSDELLITYHISQDEGRLFMEIGYHPKFEIKPVTPDEFSAGSYFESLPFQRDEKGQVVGFKVSNRRVKNIEFIKQNNIRVSH